MSGAKVVSPLYTGMTIETSCGADWLPEFFVVGMRASFLEVGDGGTHE
jgi:hypothetical protein